MTLGSSTTACFVLVCEFLSIPLKVSIVRMICNWSWDKVLYQCINVTAESQPTPKKKAALLLKLTGSQMRWLSACIFQYHSSSSSIWLKVHFPHNRDTFMSCIKKKQADSTGTWSLWALFSDFCIPSWSSVTLHSPLVFGVCWSVASLMYIKSRVARLENE